jgi:hypothetical protein
MFAHCRARFRSGSLQPSAKRNDGITPASSFFLSSMPMNAYLESEIAELSRIPKKAGQTP